MGVFDVGSTIMDEHIAYEHKMKDMNRIIGKYKCPCCGFYTFDEKLNGNYDICPVCFWEDDPIQLEDNEYEGGANRVSLIQARHNFLLFGACEEEMKKHVRKPKEDELCGID